MMVGQVFGSAVGDSLLFFAHSSQPLRLNPAAAMMMPRHFKNSFSMKGQIFDPLSLLFISCKTSFNLASLDFQFFEENSTINKIVVSIYKKEKRNKQDKHTLNVSLRNRCAIKILYCALVISSKFFKPMPLSSSSSSSPSGWDSATTFHCNVCDQAAVITTAWSCKAAIHQSAACFLLA
jgi:hypothetical protein